MKREWKPGDMARTVAGGTIARTATHRWILLEDGHPIGWEDDSRIARPLVVIDPEDREQVDDLCTTIAGTPQSDTRPLVDVLRDALREFANPTAPKPEEPIGLGAVIEDAGGVPWVRCENAEREPHWYARNKMRDYADIAAVRVLSDGVTA